MTGTRVRRILGGKRYILLDTFVTKRGAQGEAKRLRGSGRLARVVPLPRAPERPFGVYVRRK